MARTPKHLCVYSQDLPLQRKTATSRNKTTILNWTDNQIKPSTIQLKKKETDKIPNRIFY
jgi:hypothetical protein